MIKRFLVAVVALAAFGLPARASVVPYCDSFCGGNDTAAFSSALGLDGYTYVNGTDLTITGTLSDGGLQYLDGQTGVMFAASSAFTITSLTLQTAANGVLTISVPAVFGAIQLSLSQTGAPGSAITYDDSFFDSVYLTSSPMTLDYLNTAPGSNWTITLTPATSGERITVNGFNPAGTSQGSTGGDTPEVGTLLLIGSGLIGMRWMKRVPRRFFGTPQTA
jgi:hypothetical protein